MSAPALQPGIQTQMDISFSAAVLEQLGAPVLVVDAADRCVYWNAAGGDVLRNLKYAPAALADAWLLNADPDALATLASVRQHGSTKVCVTTWPGADGTPLSVEWTVTPWYSTPAQRYLTLLGRSVPAQDPLEKALKDSEVRFLALANQAPVGIFISNVDGDVPFANPKAHTLAGLAEGSTEGSAWAQAIHPEDRPRVGEALRFAIDHRVDYYCEFRFVHADGDTQWVLSRSTVLRDADGRVNGRIGTLTDLTESKRRELDLVKARDQAQAANAANRAKSAFLSSMSHELRTPLNAVLGFAQLLQLGRVQSLNDQALNYVKNILDAGEHVIALIDQILDFAAVDSGAVKLNPQTLSLHDAVSSAVRMVQPLADKAGIALGWSPAEFEALSVYVDPMRLRQVLMNLISNAIKYNRSEGSVTVARLRPSYDRIRVLVSDTGRGISQAAMERLFTPFDRLGMEGSNISGSGIGLVITRQLVELMGGSMGVDSEENVGSTFWFELPAATSADVTGSS